MVPKVHLTSHSRMSGSRWVITPSWLSGSWRSFLYSSSVYSCHSFLISSAFVRYTISALYCAHLCMKCSLGICNFLEEISNISYSIVFLYFFGLITKEGFLISLCSSLELCIQMGISLIFSFAFHFFPQLFVRPWFFSGLLTYPSWLLALGNWPFSIIGSQVPSSLAWVSDLL